MSDEHTNNGTTDLKKLPEMEAKKFLICLMSIQHLRFKEKEQTTLSQKAHIHIN